MWASVLGIEGQQFIRLLEFLIFVTNSVMYIARSVWKCEETRETKFRMVKKIYNSLVHLSGKGKGMWGVHKRSATLKIWKSMVKGSRKSVVSSILSLVHQKIQPFVLLRKWSMASHCLWNSLCHSIQDSKDPALINLSSHTCYLYPIVCLVYQTTRVF